MSLRRRLKSTPEPQPVPEDCECGCGGVGVVVAREDLIDYLESHRTDADLDALDACLDAEAGGDAATALDHYCRSLHVPGLPHEVMLDTLELLGPSAPPWALGRWIVAQAWWRMLVDHDPRVDQAVKTAMAACYDLDGMDAEAIMQLGTMQVASDRVAMDTGLFHLGGLASFIEEHVTDELAERAPDMAAWIEEPMKVYRLESSTGSRLVVRDIRDDRTRAVYDIGSFEGVKRGDHVIGRVVPDGGGGEIFQARPLRIDQETADRIARDETENVDGPCEPWVWHVGEATTEERLPIGFGRGVSHVLCDLTVAAGSDRVAYPGLVRLMTWVPSRPPTPRATAHVAISSAMK